MSMTRQQSSTHGQGKRRHAGDASPRVNGHGDTTVREAGRKGGQRVRELVSAGRQAEQRTRH
jgi:hypothetical protein